MVFCEQSSLKDSKHGTTGRRRYCFRLSLNAARRRRGRSAYYRRHVVVDTPPRHLLQNRDRTRNPRFRRHDRWNGDARRSSRGAETRMTTYWLAARTRLGACKEIRGSSQRTRESGCFFSMPPFLFFFFFFFFFFILFAGHLLYTFYNDCWESQHKIVLLPAPSQRSSLEMSARGRMMCHRSCSIYKY